MTRLLLGIQKLDHSNTDTLKTRLYKASELWQNVSGKSVIYIMSRDQRVADNHALIAAQKHALALKLPFAVLFCLYPKSGNRAREHFEFMLEGLKEVEASLDKLHIPFILLLGDPAECLKATVNHYRPAVAYFDFNPLRGPQKIVSQVAALCSTIVVDTHNIVPVKVVGSKQEYAARTIRPKIHLHLPAHVVEPEIVQSHPYSWQGPIIPMAKLQSKIDSLLVCMSANRTVTAAKSGESEALKALEDFISHRLSGYSERRNNPTLNGLSELSPYLHFGQLSSLRVVLRSLSVVSIDASLQNDVDALLEELVIRKELSDNYCLYNGNYDLLSGAPEWAQATLSKHASDQREFVYSRKQFEAADTHDEAWNAAQRQLLQTGKIHGYMRMYWAKKILEWSASPKEALRTAIYLNDFYSIDGGDPNGYVGILWSIAGLHDRPWGERAVYGTVRSMVYSGLRRKFDTQAYIDKYNK